MAENNQLSDEAKINSMDTSPTDDSSAVIGDHENAVVPHKISNHDKLVQTMVMVDGEWINLNDTNDQANMKYDMHKVNKKVVEAQKGIVEAKNTADSAVKYADSAVSASKVNSYALVAQSSAISEAKAAADDAASKAQFIKENASSEAVAIRNQVADVANNVSSVKADVASAATKAELSVNGLTTRVTAIEGDNKKLSNQIASTETILQQTKDQLLQKADKSIVDQANNLISQLSAEQKIMAGQIEQKASSTELDNALTSINKNTTAIDENSKAIKLKADATEVNNLKGTVNSHSASINLFSDQLKSMVTESKVNDIINGKGFATQSTVQSLIDQKAGTINESITNLTNKLVNNNGGGVNLVSGTIEDIVVDDTANTGIHGWCFNTIPINADLKVGDKITVSVENVTTTGRGDLSKWGATLYSKDISEVRANNYEVNAGKNAQVTITVTSMNDPNKQTALLIYSGRVGDTEGKKAVFHHLKVERGEIATPYSQAPSDNATVTQLQSITASIDGLQSRVTNYQNDTSSKYTQLSDLMQSKVNKGDLESVRTQLASSINERIQKGNLITQFNLEAGRTLIQSSKIYFDADSFVMSPNSKAFIPSAYITNINADKITTGTLDAAKFNVKNFSADNIVGGTLSGVVVKTGDNDRYFQTSKNNIYWVRNGSMSLVGNDTYLNSANGLNIADEKNIQLTTWGGATVNKDGSITNNSGNYGHPKIVIDREGNFNPDDPYGAPFAGGPGDSEIVQWVGNKEYTALTRGKGFTVHLNDGNNKSTFTIQKDNKVGVYVGSGDDGSEIRIVGPGSGSIKLQGEYIDDGFNDALTHTLGNLQVDNLHVRKWLGVDQSKNAIVKTSQGPVTINAYETAEYYFGDIGEGQTSTDGIAYIGIEKLFNETVNTTIPYHVFITAYGAGNIWVDQREHNRFIVKSDQPNLKFSWEIKAKRKGYEQTRLQNVNDKLNHMAATS